MTSLDMPASGFLSSRAEDLTINDFASLSNLIDAGLTYKKSNDILKRL